MPHVFGGISDEVHKDQTIFIGSKGLTQCGLDILRLVNTHANMAVALDQFDKVGQCIDIGLGIARTIVNLLPLTNHTEITVVQTDDLWRSEERRVGEECSLWWSWG